MKTIFVVVAALFVGLCWAFLTNVKANDTAQVSEFQWHSIGENTRARSIKRHLGYCVVVVRDHASTGSVAVSCVK